MNIKAILSKKVSSQSGQSKSTGNPWRVDEWLLAIPGMKTKYIKVEVSGVERCIAWERFYDGLPNKNDPVQVQFEIDANEYEGRWFNRLQAWDISMAQGW